MAAPIDPAERLLNLVIALVNTAGRMTKEQVRTTVAGYADAPSDDAFERMFERDKDTLRSLGVPVLTVTDARYGDDVGYRIDVDAYALPPIDLTAAELGVLALAAQLWQDRSLRADSGRALTKLRAVGVGPQAADLVAGLAPHARAGGDAVGPLVDAVQARQPVRFTYRAATTGEVRERHVEPWRLLARRGGWVLVGRDRDRGAVRSFRLTRIDGAVVGDGPAASFPPPSADELAEALRAWTARPERLAALAVRPERAGATRARAVPAPTGVDAAAIPGAASVLATRELIHVPFGSVHELADELVGYGDAVVVLAPADLRAAVLDLLTTAAALGHRPAVPGPPAAPGGGDG